ncbi:TetR/AcrR family transcriptional regulator [Vibrio marisflavi]|uniref:HTH tetR-type domain-containing protein n=1 Tax=Vibrio marisflavi CECT 7928 TaxID=634439 RepID=A0ABN8DZI2_9VIBR|nr:TetR/AcrR family transcriptional regulator [Vibrio marisflavi]CAH0536099.1 hypothetical protein VMF7928_00195 [Vibrio marisflavi CECT 7928]
MNTTQKKPGRPAGSEHDVRNKLISCSLKLFLSMPYEKISTRLIASKAEVSSSLIRYYFGNKDGLYESVIESMFEPFHMPFANFIANADSASLFQLLAALFEELKNNPQLPQFIYQILARPQHDRNREYLTQTIEWFTNRIDDNFLNKLVENKVIREGMKPELCRLSWISLIICPFLIPSGLLDTMTKGQSKEEFFNDLLMHNISIMRHGFVGSH